MNKTLQSTILILVLLIISSIMIYYYHTDLKDNQKDKEKLEDTKKWFWALVNDDYKSAITEATKLMESDNNHQEVSIPSTYKSLFKENGLSPDFLSENFNKFDYQLWSDAFFFTHLANQTLKKLSQLDKDNDNAKISALFKLVDSALSNEDVPKGTIIWPFAVWYFKKGLCDRQAWVLCELAYQAGYETQIIYLMDPGSNVSPHTICEIRKDDKKWLADPFSNILLCDTSLADLDSNDALKEKIWPNRKRWQQAVHDAIYWTPSYPQDYCPRNQQLQKSLKSVLKNNTPRFGEDPELRRQRFMSLVDQKVRSKHQSKLWFTPIRLLAIQKEFDRLKKSSK